MGDLFLDLYVLRVLLGFHCCWMSLFNTAAIASKFVEHKTNLLKVWNIKASAHISLRDLLYLWSVSLILRLVRKYLFIVFSNVITRKALQVADVSLKLNLLKWFPGCAGNQTWVGHNLCKPIQFILKLSRNILLVPIYLLKHVKEKLPWRICYQFVVVVLFVTKYINISNRSKD